MSEIKVAYIQNGIICGKVEISDEEYIFTNPVLLQPTSQGLSLSDLLGFCLEDSITLKKSEIMFGGQLLTPINEIIEVYNKQMNPSAILTPDKKLVL